MLLYSTYKLSEYYTLYSSLSLFWAIFFILIYALVYFLYWRGKDKNLMQIFDEFLMIFLLSVAFSFFGLTVGLMTGLSESPVIESAITAIFSLFGGFASLAFFSKESGGINTYKYNIRIIALFFISVSFCMMLGLDYGSQQRLEAQKKLKEIPQKIEQNNPPGLKEGGNSLILERKARPKH